MTKKEYRKLVEDIGLMKECVKDWILRVQGQVPKRYCVLCKGYPGPCDLCPISIDTGFPRCLGTPLEKYKEKPNAENTILMCAYLIGLLEKLEKQHADEVAKREKQEDERPIGSTGVGGRHGIWAQVNYDNEILTSIHQPSTKEAKRNVADMANVMCWSMIQWSGDNE